MSKAQLKVYFDGGCVVCSKEIKYYQRRDQTKKINYVDISKANFDFKSEGLDPFLAQKYFHVRSDKELLVGVSGFLQIWKTLEIWPLMIWLAETKLTRFLLELGYKLFILARPYLPRKKCETDNCQF